MTVRRFFRVYFGFFLTMAFCSLCEAANNYTPTGFYYPIGTEDIQVSSSCGRFLEKPAGYGGCYPFEGNPVYHIGVDIKADYGQDVRAIADGKVIQRLGSGWGNGNTALLVEHHSMEVGMFRAVYGHIQDNSSALANNTSVLAGDVIGRIGAWDYGDHLHFGMLAPGLPSAIDQSSNGRWLYSDYGVKDSEGYYDNGFIDPIWFMSHFGPDNALSRNVYAACVETVPPLSKFPNHPWFFDTCIVSYPDPHCPCDNSSIGAYIECTENKDALCTAVQPSTWNALGTAGSTSGETYGVGGDIPIDPPPSPPPTTNLPNLKVREITVYDANDYLLTERDSVLIPGEVLDGQVNILSLEETCSNGIADGKDTVETDIYYKIALGDDVGNYVFLTRVYTEVWRLTEDNHHIEHFSYTVPESAAGQRIYFRAQVDSTSEVAETNEDDNWSGTDEWYAVEGDCDIIITDVGLTNNRITLNEGEHYGIEAFITNQGTTTCPFSTRLIYYQQKPGQTSWTEMATDGTDVAELVPDFIKHEYTTGEPFVADTPGTHNLMACGDYLNDQPESNETNNCTISTFTVNSNKPNFYIHKIYFKVGSTTYQNGATIPKNSYIKPYVQMGNNGTSSIHGAFRVAYYVNADKYRDSDGVDANQVCVGCIVTEYVSSGFKLGDTGTRTYKACLDYEGKVAETNENDNCQTITFYVK